MAKNEIPGWAKEIGYELHGDETDHDPKLIAARFGGLVEFAEAWAESCEHDSTAGLTPAEELIRQQVGAKARAALAQLRGYE